MKVLLLVISLLLFSSNLEAERIHLGLSTTLGTAIGTGKANWDWTDATMDIQRHTPLTLGVALPVLIRMGSLFQLETGLGYYWNRTAVQNGPEIREYQQNSLEVPLALRLYLLPENQTFYIKSGTALLYLHGPGRFDNLIDHESFFTGHLPGKQLHAALQVGAGYMLKKKNSSWQIELHYITFYSSPEYLRIDGTLADIRFHRMALNMACYF